MLEFILVVRTESLSPIKERQYLLQPESSRKKLPFPEQRGLECCKNSWISLKKALGRKQQIAGDA